MTIKRRIALCFVFMAACSVGPCALWAEDMQTQQQLESCISLYRNGEYQKTADGLTMLLPFMTAWEDSFSALKYLGYSYGMLGRIDQAKRYFKIVLERRPGMEIDTLECPPNITVIFRQVKLEQVLAAFDSVESDKPGNIHLGKRTVFPVILLVSAIGTAGVGGYFYYSGTVLQQKYRSINKPDQNLIDRSYNDFRTAYVTSAVSFGISAVFLWSSLDLLLRNDSLPFHLALKEINGRCSLALLF